MAITIGNTTWTEKESWDSTALVIAAPSGIADNDILLTGVLAYTSGTGFLPAGFTQIGQNPIDGTSRYWTLAWKRAASESGSYSFSDGSHELSAGWITVIKGCKTSDSPLNVAISDTSYTTSDTHVRAASLTPTVEVALLWFGSSYSGFTVGTPTGFTSDLDEEDGFGNAVMVAHKLAVTAGATGTIDGEIGGEDTRKHAMMVALEPAPASPQIFWMRA